VGGHPVAKGAAVVGTAKVSRTASTAGRTVVRIDATVVIDQ
jgi:hypothetical protein